VRVLNAVKAIDEETVYTAGLGGAVFRSTNGGDAWERIESSTTSTFYGLDVYGDSRVVIAGNNCTFMHTTDAGVNWSTVEYGPSGHYMSAVSYADADNVYAAGESGFIFHSGDGGAGWERVYAPVYQDLFGVDAVDSRHVWAVGKRASILSTKNPADVSTGISGSRREPDPRSFAVLMQNYPNPFGPGSTSGSPVTNIVYRLDRSAYVELSVYDALGRKMYTAVSGQRTAGLHVETISSSHLPAGVYFCRLRSGVDAVTRRMVVVR
jgi:hypothetical protein